MELTGKSKDAIEKMMDRTDMNFCEVIKYYLNNDYPN